MPRGGARPGTGGARPGAGRPRKDAALPAGLLRDLKPLPAKVAAAPVAPVVIPPGGQTPLEYMLAVINDQSADQARRDRMAQAAAPYVHPRACSEGEGKKAERQRKAMGAERGTEWEDLLDDRPAN